jgi:hypothetical protein
VGGGGSGDMFTKWICGRNEMKKKKKQMLVFPV